MKKYLSAFIYAWIFSSVAFLNAQTLSPSTSQLNFGNVYENAPDSLLLTLNNTLGKPVTVTGIRFYNIYGLPAFTASANYFTLADGGSVNLWIKFSPRHNIFHNSEMIIENDGLRGDVRIDLIGQGKYSNNYYNGTENLSEENLKVAIKTTVSSGYVSLLYNPARDSMFMSIDNKKTNGQGASQNTLECVYTGREAIGYIDRTDCQNNFAFNTEHTFPQSLFTSLEPMKSDLHHLFPTDNVANNERGDNPFGIVTSPSWTNGGSKSDGTIFEPRDDQKGRAARALFYFVLRYQNYSSFLNSQESILRTWCLAYPPDQKDIIRNNDIFSMQHNRNPFIDYPAFLERINTLATNSIAPLFNAMDISDDTLVYGMIPTGTPVLYDFIVVNNGNTPLNLTNFNLTHPGELSFSNSGNDTTISPGEALTLHINCLTTVTDSIRAFLSFNSSATTGSVVVPIFVNDLIYSGIYESVSGVHVFPNPATEKITISLRSKGRNMQLFLFDMMGKQVIHLSLDSNEETIDVSNLSYGVYLMQLSENAGTIMKKVIVE